ncbi:MAG: carboxypeptidase-like regulatory domain-containing protein [Planctomycetaceae bacterium]
MESFRKSPLTGVLALCLLAGCGGVDDKPKLGTVTGTVTMDGQPLPNVWVMFNPTTGRTALGHTDENGHYELKFTEDADGANLGSHKVVIMTYHEDEIAEQQINTGKAPKEPIPAKYNAKTTLTAEVKEGENVIDFPLESK